MNPRSFFSDADLERIAGAARAAERQTSGEIVPCVVGVCDDYPEAVWRAASIGALAGGGGGFALHFIGGVWGGSALHWVVLPAVVVSILGVVAVLASAAIRRIVIGAGTLDHRARQRAEIAFLEEEVFDTRDRTGILVFVALFERRVVVMGDAGINSVVPDGAWTHVVDDLVAGIKSGRSAEALAAAITECGRLLAEHEVEIRPDDTDELGNELRIRER